MRQYRGCSEGDVEVVLTCVKCSKTCIAGSAAVTISPLGQERGKIAKWVRKIKQIVLRVRVFVNTR